MAEITQSEDGHFGLANIPFGVISTQVNGTPSIATRVFGGVYTMQDLIDQGLLEFSEEEIEDALLQVRQWNVSKRPGKC